MTEHVVGTVAEIEETDRFIAEINGIEIAVFRIDDEFHAIPNYCLHQGGPCAEGPVTGTTRAAFDREKLELTVEYTDRGKILNCPWHSWEYDIRTGRCLSRHGVRLPTYPVKVDDKNVIVSL